MFLLFRVDKKITLEALSLRACFACYHFMGVKLGRVTPEDIRKSPKIWMNCWKRGWQGSKRQTTPEVWNLM
jgi:hypothetical protein